MSVLLYSWPDLHTLQHIKTHFLFCIPAILNRASLSQFPLKNDCPSPSFIWSFEVPSCWDKLEPRKRGANWMIILVWVPEMSVGKSQVPVLSHCWPSPLCPGSRWTQWFREFSSLSTNEWRWERPRCCPVSGVLTTCLCDGLEHKQATSMLMHAQLKRTNEIPGFTISLTHDRGKGAFLFGALRSGKLWDRQQQCTTGLFYQLLLSFWIVPAVGCCYYVLLCVVH